MLVAIFASTRKSTSSGKSAYSSRPILRGLRSGWPRAKTLSRTGLGLLETDSEGYDPGGTAWVAKRPHN